jgi:glyoxylase-like metal-dependent hydrolase (beta-lactamase superfamily II)
MNGFTVGGAGVEVFEDGSFFMSSDFLTGAADPGTDERDAKGRARLPVQAFVVRGSATVLVDAGLGPDPEGSLRAIAAQVGIDRGDIGLVGRAGLRQGLDLSGIHPDAVDVVVVSHLHADHTGWLVNADGSTLFRNAQILVPRADFEHFVEGGRTAMAPTTVDGLRSMVTSGRAELFEGEVSVSREITALPAPGHTPGHTVFAIVDGGERAMILGDALYCPMQLTHVEIGAMHDVDPALARRTRELIARDSEAHGTRTVGCHFAGGRAARLAGGRVELS